MRLRTPGVGAWCRRCSWRWSLVPLLAAGTGRGGRHADPDQGSGSSWAENAVNQWVADVNSEGVQVVYNPDGDAQGRQDYANKVSDFAVTSDGYQGVDPVTGVVRHVRGRPYAYLPIAAGGRRSPTRSGSTASRSRTCGCRV